MTDLKHTNADNNANAGNVQDTTRPSDRLPMVSVAASMMAGIICGAYFKAHTSLWLFLAAALLTAAVITFRRRDLKTLAKTLLAAAIIAAGAASISLKTSAIPADHIAGALKSGPMIPATIEGKALRVTQLDSSLTNSDFATFERNPQTIILLDSQHYAAADGSPTPCSGLVSVTVDGTCGDIPIGSRLKITGIAGRRGRMRNPRPNSSHIQQVQSGIFARLFVATPQLVEILPREKLPAVKSAFSHFTGRLKSIASDRLVSNCDDTSAMMLNAIVLGQRDSELGQLQEAMVRSGTAHLLSISGMHLAILAATGIWILRLCGASPRLSALITLLMLCVYLLVVQARPPVLRGSILLGGYCIATLCGRRAATLNMLSVAAVILLATDPMELFRAGFQLSFGVTAGIILMYQPVRQLLFGRVLARSSLMIFDESDYSAISRFWHRTALPVAAGMISASVAAFLASVPLIWYHFRIFTPLAPLATLAVLPLTAALLTLGYIKLALAATGVLMPLANTLSGPVESFSAAFANLVHFLARVSPCFELPPASPLAAALAGGAILTAAVTLKSESGRKRFGGFMLAGTLLAATAALTLWPVRPEYPEFTLLDVRNGQAAMLQSCSGKVYIFDAGSRSIVKPYESVLKPAMQAAGKSSPEAAFVSHADCDHYNALAGLLNEGKHTTIYTGEYFGRGKGSDPQLEMFEDLMSNRAIRKSLRAGEIIHMEEDISVEVLYPLTDPVEGQMENDLSMVLLVRCGDRKILIPGDLQSEGQKILAGTCPKLKADVLVLPHHGAWTENLDQFIAAVDPEIILQSSAKKPTIAASKTATLVNGRKFYPTSRCGAITVQLTDKALRVETAITQ